MNYSQLPQLLKEDIESAGLNSSFQTPVILCSKKCLEFNIDYFRKNIPVDKILFPVKVNHDPVVLRAIAKCGASFEISSFNEMNLLQDNMLLKEDTVFSTPLRIRSHTEAAFKAGVRTFAIDRISEIRKLAEVAPRSDVMIRLAVLNAGAEWKLDQKFGADTRSVLKLMKAAEEMNLNACGISFHVGWNNKNLNTWRSAVTNAVHRAQIAVRKGFRVRFINIGGGFPAHNMDQYGELIKISSAIRPLLIEAQEQQGIEIWAEPGSFISANASLLITKVIDVARRNGKNWVCLDAGLFQGFYWKLGGLKYNVVSLQDTCKEKKQWIVTGPTCDSQDVFDRSARLPANLKEDDLLLVLPAGAYINSAREYNGFAYPKSYFCE